MRQPPFGSIRPHSGRCQVRRTGEPLADFTTECFSRERYWRLARTRCRMAGIAASPWPSPATMFVEFTHPSVGTEAMTLW